jgi:hypothetical protein
MDGIFTDFLVIYMALMARQVFLEVLLAVEGGGVVFHQTAIRIMEELAIIAEEMVTTPAAYITAVEEAALVQPEQVGRNQTAAMVTHHP